MALAERGRISRHSACDDTCTYTRDDVWSVFGSERE